MNPDIVLIREESAYRLVFGHLRVVGALSTANETHIDVKGEGTVKVVKTPAGLFVEHKNTKLPFLMA